MVLHIITKTYSLLKLKMNTLLVAFDLTAREHVNQNSTFGLTCRKLL